MAKARSVAVALFITAVHLSSCDESKRLVQGQVFVTQGEVTVRLPLTEVHVFEVSAAADMLNKWHRLREGKLAELSIQLSQADAELQSFTTAELPKLTSAERANRTFARLYYERIRFEDIIRDPALTGQPIRAAFVEVERIQKEMDAVRPSTLPDKEVKLMAERWNRLRVAQDSVAKEQANARKLSSYAKLEQVSAVALATADVDGKFSLHIPNNPVAIFARRPQDASATEDYVWIVRIEPKQNTVLLTGKNLIDENASDNLGADRAPPQ